jgi:phosphotransferase system HPr (HPr) family protein
MKQAEVTVPWPNGLHLRTAANLVRIAQRFQSNICLRLGEQVADTRSVLSVVLLSAGQGARMIVEVTGLDEHDALQELTGFFNAPQA